MGSTVSSAVRTGAKTAGNVTSRSTAKQHQQVTARLQESKAPQYHRKTPEEWSETLKKISGAITSSAWEGEQKPHLQNLTSKERHAAQRSDAASESLPGRRKADNDSVRRNEHGTLQKPDARLTQNQILHIFNLRRRDPQKWNVASIASKYALSEEDVSNLLSFSRTYTARMDSDGQVRGYYNTDPENTISRFEKD